MSKYFHTDDPVTISFLGWTMLLAEKHGQRVRIDVENGELKIKRGEGMWSPPLASTPDPYRDTSNEGE